jgi:uncharacterized protein (TIGR02147 family)
VELALGSIDAVPVTERHVSGITAGISAETYEVLSAEIGAFKDRIVSIINRQPGSDRVYQLNVQLFPLSKGHRPATRDDRGRQ